MLTFSPNWGMSSSANAAVTWYVRFGCIRHRNGHWDLLAIVALVMSMSAPVGVLSSNGESA